MNIPSVVVTEEMTRAEQNAAVEAGIALELKMMAETIGWKLLIEGLGAKIERLVGEITSSHTVLEARVEDRKRGEIAAYRDVIASVAKTEASARRLEEQAAKQKERDHVPAAAGPADGNPFRDLPGFG